MSYKTTAELKREQGPEARSNASRLRRLAIGITSRVFWQLVGYKSHESKTPTTDAEPFTGIGFYARPRSTDRAEAVLASIGDARHSVIIATRNEDVRKQIANLEEDETAIFTSQSTVVIKADGTIEIRSANGVALPLPTLQEIASFISAYNLHVHTETGTVTTVPTVLVSAPSGTTVLKAE